MFNQFKIESFKMKRFIPFYVCIGIMIIIAISGAVNGLKQAAIDYWGYGNMHDGFIDSVQDCSFSFLYGMLISWYVGIDFTNRTLHRAIVTGNKRWTMIVSRIMAVSVLTFIIHIFLIISQLATFGKTFGYSFEGFGVTDLVWLGVVALQIIAFSSFFYLTAVQSNTIDLTYLFYYTALYGLMFIAPLLTMWLISGERKNGTDQLLMTAPISMTKLVIAKFLSALLLIVVPVILTLMYFVIAA